MSYSGNMPDWHQYNPPQHGRTSTASSGQNVNSNHLFLSNINPIGIDTINLSTSDRQNKHQQRNDVNYPGRNYATSAISGPNCATSSTSGVHTMAPLSGCVSHYGTSPSRNTMIEGITTAMDPRLPPSVLPLNETDLPHRNNPMPFNPPTNHTTSSSLSGIHGAMASQTSPVGPMSPGRQVPPYGTCKGPCCNPDANIAAYQHWEKYGHYQTNTAYRDNMRPGHYPIENRRYVPPDISGIRKECIDNKELVSSGPYGVDNRRNYPEYKYRKDLPRNYPASGLLQNYPMQNYSFPDYQKCPYSVKDYLRRGSVNGPTINSQNSPMIPKYPEQQSVIVQQKYNGKQLPYHNGTQQSTITNTSTSNLPSALQNSYYNAQLTAREVPRDFSRDYQDTNNVANRLPTSTAAVVHSSYEKYHVYQQKITMQRYSLENHLRMMSRMPGYQSHPKYQEYMVKYRELSRLQQNVDYQGVLQETSKLQSPSGAQIPPINLQFDQNGVLINSNYNSGHFSGMHNTINSISNADNAENVATNQANIVSGGSIEQQNHFIKHTDQSINLSRDAENIRFANKAIRDRYLMQKNNEHMEQFENLIVDGNELDCARAVTTAVNTMATTTMTTIDNVNLREFANKPELDVRQFLANWDESEDEETVATNLSMATTNNPSLNVVSDCSPSTKNSHTEVIEKQPEETNTAEKTMEEATIVDTNILVHNSGENIEVTDLKTIEELANSGTIVQCIQTDVDDIPTIHIVDRLPNDSELTTIQTVYGDVTSLTIEQIAKAPIEIINETPQGTETITLYEADSGVCTKDPECNDMPDNDAVEGEAVVEANIATIIDTSIERTVTSKCSPETIINESEKSAELTYEKSSTQCETVVDNSAQGIDLTIKSHQSSGERSNLRKQHSFASEESHNPDDISLPDLPMSECTPISTTLNTPIHSDSEESSEHVANLEISTNPIEVIPNSPIISFTHSPIKIYPYGNLENDRLSEKRPHDSLDFDFHQEENSKNKYGNDTGDKTPVENFEMAQRPTEPIVESTVEVESEAQNEMSLISTTTTDKSSEKEVEFYPSSDPLVGMGQNSNMVTKQTSNNSPVIGGDISNDIIHTGECLVESLGGNTVPGTPVSRILSPDEIDTGKCPSIIDTEDFQPSDDLDKLCNMSLDDACMMSLMSEDNSRESRIQSAQLGENSFTKVMNDILPISDLNVLESSDDESDKDDDDAWVEVRSLDGSIVAELGANEAASNTKNSDVKSPNNEEKKCLNEKLENKFDNFNAIEKTTNHQKTVSNWSEYTKFKHNSQNDSHSTKSIEERAYEERPKYIPSIFDVSGDSQSTDFDKFDRKKQELNDRERLKSVRDYRQEKSCDKLNRTERYHTDSHSQSNNTDISDCSMVKVKTIEPCTRTSYDKNVEETIQKKPIENTENLPNDKLIYSNCDTLPLLDSYETCTVIKSSRQAHKDTDVQIQVANINIEKISDDDVDSGFEIKIDVSHSERNCISKQSQHKFNEITKAIREHASISFDTSTHSYPESITNQRRLSIPHQLESKRPKKLNNEIKRRHSGGHNFKSYYRRSVEQNSTDDNNETRNSNTGDSHFTLSTVSENEISSKEDSNQITMSTIAPVSSQNVSQEFNVHENVPPSSTCKDDQIDSENESVFEHAMENSRDSNRKLSVKASETNISHSNIDDLTNIVSRSSFDMTPGPSNATSNDPWNKPSFFVESISTLDFDNFDVAPNELRDFTENIPLTNDNDEIYLRTEKEVRNKRLDDIERYRNPYSTPKPPVMDAMEMNLNSVPIYITKDGKITWSPNPRYTYKTLIMEARQREGYPAIPDLHHSSRSSRNYHEKRLYKRKYASPTNETKPYNENMNYNTKRIKLPFPRRRFDDSEWTNTTNRSITNRYDNKRRERNIEVGSVKDDRSKIYSDISMPPSICSIDSSFKAQHYRYSPAVLSSMKQLEKQHHYNYDYYSTMISRKQNDTNLVGQCAIENTIGDPLTNHSLGQNSEILDGIMCNASSKIFNGVELELFSTNVSNISSDIAAKKTMESSIERVLRPDNRLSPLKQNFVINKKESRNNQDNWTVPHSMNTTMSDDESKDISRNSIVEMKPPPSVDVEHDSQAILTDSGLASSTCTEGSKELRRGGEQWKRTLRNSNDKVKSSKNIYATPNSPEHVSKNKTDSFAAENNLEVTENITMSEVSRETEVAEMELTKEYNDRHQSDEEKKIVETPKCNYVSIESKKPKESIDITKLTELFLSKNYGKNIDSSILKGLDLAFPTRPIVTKQPQMQINVECSAEDLTLKSQEDESKPASIFNNQHGSKFSRVMRTDEGPSRRASSDEVESRKRINTPFEHITSSVDTPMSISIAGTDAMSIISDRPIFDKNIGKRESYELITNANNDTEFTETNCLTLGALTHKEEYKFEKPEIPLIRFGPFNNPAQKTNDIENSEVSTESESHYDDTLSSTQFGSECADSKSNETNTILNTGINFLSATSQEAIDATDLNQVRKNLALCDLNDKSEIRNKQMHCGIANSSQIVDDKMLKCENIKEEKDAGKLLTFSGRISSESEDDSNAQDGSPIGNNNAAVINLCTKSGKETNRILNFSGRIPSPENQSEYHLQKQLSDAKDHKIFSSNIVIVNDDKNFTFTGKIQNEQCKSSCISPPITEKIPKFIIKKTDSLSKLSSISQIFSSEQVTQQSNETKASLSHRSSLHPKIPKMIIRNVRSRPVTPTIEENAVELSFPKSHDSEQKVFEVKIKLDDTTIKHDVEASTMRRSIDIIECKIPKMKIKLEDRIPKMIFKNARVEMFDNNESESSKNMSKVKMRKIKRSNSKEEKSTSKVKERTQTNLDKSQRSNTGEKSKESSYKSSASNQRLEPPSRHELKQEKIRKLKMKKQDTCVSSSSSDSGRKKHSKSPTESSQRNQKKSSSRHRNSESKSTDRSQSLDNDGNTSQSNSEKIPKVIIKRTSPSAEFKCELSKDGTAAMIQSPKWQPEVKLERFKVLDSIAMSPGRITLPSKMLEIISKEREKAEVFTSSRSGLSSLHRLSSTTQRRHSDSERLSKSNKSPNNYNDARKTKNTVRKLDYDSDSEVFPRIIRRGTVRKLNDDSSMEETTKLKPTSIIDISKIKMKETPIQETSNQSLFEKPQVTITKSEFEFTCASSSHNEINNSTTIEATISAHRMKSDGGAIVHTKHHNAVNFEEPESVIKLESSDESQTTIEILPASPDDISQPESEIPMHIDGQQRIANGDMAQLYSEDAIPTQFELELEIVDNSPESLDVPIPLSNIDCGNDSRSVISYATSKGINEKRTNWNHSVKFNDDTTACSNSVMTPGPSSHRRSSDEGDRETTNQQMTNMCCSDSLVKEVLAAKETLKRCLAISKHESKFKCLLMSRPKTAAEKKQGIEFNVSGHSKGKCELEINKNHHHVFQESNVTLCGVSQNDFIKSECKKVDRRYTKSDENSNTTNKREKRCKITTDIRRHEESISICDPSSRDDTSMSNTHNSIRSLKRSRALSELSEFSINPPRKIRLPSTSTSISLSAENTQTKASDTFGKRYESARRSIDSKPQPCGSPSTIDHSSKMIAYKIPKISKLQESQKSVSEVKIKAMPILEPVNQVDFHASECDTSRSPPVITKQDSSNEICPESPKKIEEKESEKIDTIMNQETEAVTFADIVAQMAYHEKATIKHRRYCILCERWFPTAARHRRHLTGYQHRHTELTQRRTVHALFMLFTGKPCPRLLPASIVRTDCAPGEPTPLQIAVQDVAISLEAGANDKTKNVNNENK